MPTQGFQQVQKQTQSLVLAPQLRQSLKILQVAALDLRNVILEELQSNPTLEELPMDGISIDAKEQKSESSFDEGDVASHKEELEFGKSYETFSRMQEDYRDYYADENGSFSYSAEDEERRKHFFDSITSDVSLQENLMRQAELSDASTEVLKAMEYLVGSLNDSGFLGSNISDIALLAGLPLKTVQEAQRLLKRLEPVGIGSTDLKDCLLTQLEQRGEKDSPAYEIIKKYFELLLRRRIPELARRMGLSPEDIQDAIEVIGTLDPAPGRQFSDDNNRVVIPDVTVEQDDTGEWLVTLNNDFIPRLRINPAYKEMMAKGTLQKKEKDYLQDKVRSSKFLISSIEQRQQTIERITRQLLEFQKEFFDEGPSKLKPLTMNKVAEQVGVHETTVSRAIANKYIRTPHGVFDFKYFFTTGYQNDSGDTMSNTSVKERIAKIIESENSMKPYSDQKIVDILKEEGVNIARRTVAKYREELGILPTNLRRRYD
ncbi:MAG: RNA polymerase factor sigma-54 [Opitutales bacterium]|nr:RNA polymerase factor sigma-54 [Opitutales bacterium]